ncbi:hypothetical protein Zm00014a_041958 [Zea mays]|uniref:Uncharacterized protein n=1 Tax=Zea mays TaxID=4577 RepID=A0A3L6DTQ4_MAIZE|nr:hypothetical protein Zm00014a_041958 [Zea mays]
MALGAVESA